MMEELRSLWKKIKYRWVNGIWVEALSIVTLLMEGMVKCKRLQEMVEIAVLSTDLGDWPRIKGTGVNQTDDW